MYFFSVHVKKQLLLSRSMQVKASFCTYALQTLDCRLLICSSKCLRLYKILKDYIKIIQKNPPRSLKTLEFCNSSEKKKNGCLVILELGTKNKVVEKIYLWRSLTNVFEDLDKVIWWFFRKSLSEKSLWNETLWMSFWI